MEEQTNEEKEVKIESVEEKPSETEIIKDENIEENKE